MMYERLAKVVDAIVGGEGAEAGRLLEDARGGQAPPAEALAASVFSRALARRVARTPAKGNLYLSDFDVAQIDLFGLVARRLPSVAVTTASAASMLCDLCRGRDEATIVDVGIGTGRQVEGWLRALAAGEGRPQRVTLVGIEPSHDSLVAARAAIARASAATGIVVDFFDVCAPIEDVLDSSWKQIRQVAPRPVVNASFALHHVRDDARDAVLREIHALEPRAIVLTEPDVDHVEPDLRRRFANCWNHFLATFRLVDSLELSRPEKDALCVGFFGREIDDIVGSPEAERCERHEPLSSWSRRLRGAGFGSAREVRYLHDGVPLTGVLCAV